MFNSHPGRFTNRNQYMTGTFVYLKKDYSQNFFKNGWKIRCLWPSKNQRIWTFDMIYWALRHNKNHSNWNLANILAWKTSFIIGLSYFIHLWKSFCLELALNLSPQKLHHWIEIPNDAPDTSRKNVTPSLYPIITDGYHASAWNGDRLPPFVCICSVLHLYLFPQAKTL